MVENLEKIIFEFSKAFYKLQQLNLDKTISCLTQNEIYIIRLIGKNYFTMNDLKDKLDNTLGTTSLQISKLEKKNFVVRQKDKKDKRKVYVNLSPKGLIAYKAYEKVYDNLIKKAVENIEEKKLNDVLDTLIKLTNNLKEMQSKYKKISLFSLEVGQKATIDDIKLSYAGFKYIYEKGIAIGRDIVVLEKSKNVIVLDTFKGRKSITEDDAQNIFCIRGN